MPYEINTPPNFRAVKYSTILRGVLDLYSEDTDDPAQDFLWKRIRTFANQRLGYFWYETAWPELVRNEQRDVVDDGDDFGAYVPYQEDGISTIADVYRVFSESPYTHKTPKEVNYQLSDLGVQLYTEGELETVWVSYKPTKPELTGNNYSATTAYAEGDQVFYVDDFYTALVDTAAGSTPQADESNSDWQKVLIPLSAKDYMIHGIYYDLLKHNGEPQENLVAPKVDVDEAMNFALYRIKQVQGHNLKMRIPTR